MPKFKEFVCDVCGASEKSQIDDADPRGWIKVGFVFCPKCWKKVKDIIRPSVDQLISAMPDLFGQAEGSELKKRVAYGIIAEAVQDMRRPNQEEEGSTMR